MSSAYHDIISWAESAYPSSQYTTFTEWTKDIIADFNESGHFLPEQILGELQQHWIEEYGNLDKDTERIFGGDEELELEAEQEQQDDFKRQIEDLPSKQEFQGDLALRKQIRASKMRTQLAKRKAKGKRSRKRRKSSK